MAVGSRALRCPCPVIPLGVVVKLWHSNAQLSDISNPGENWKWPPDLPQEGPLSKCVMNHGVMRGELGPKPLYLAGDQPHASNSTPGT